MMMTWDADGRDAEKWIDSRNILEVDGTGYIVLVKGKRGSLGLLLISCIVTGWIWDDWGWIRHKTKSSAL